MYITKLVEEMKYNLGISSFQNYVESITRKRIMPKLKINNILAIYIKFKLLFCMRYPPKQHTKIRDKHYIN